MIPVNTPRLEGNEKKYLLECIESGWISSEGPFVAALETQFAQKVGRTYGIAVCNGTAALQIALKAIGIQPGDEVIMPTLTIVSCVLAVVGLGAVPVLVDSQPETWNMDVHAIEEKITKKTKAIMAVHLYGLPVEMDLILQLAEKYNLKILEDAAQMHGQTYHGKPCGSFGDVSTFSFYPNKLVTTGEGGIVVTDEKTLNEQCRLLRNLAFSKENRYCHEELGWNFRLSNLQAALGVAQLEQWEACIDKKRAMGAFYQECFSELPNVQRPLAKTSYANNIYWVFGLVLQKSKASCIMAQLKQKGIETRAFFYPMHWQPVLQQKGLFRGESYPVSEKLALHGFYIPSGLGLTKAQMTCVAEAVIDTLKEIA